MTSCRIGGVRFHRVEAPVQIRALVNRLNIQAVFSCPKGGENMKNNSIVAVIKLISGESIKIRCSKYRFGDSLVCADNVGDAVFVAPRDRVICVYSKKYRL